MAPLVLLMLAALAQAIPESTAVSLALERVDTSASSPPCTGGAYALSSGPSSGEREDGPALLLEYSPVRARTRLHVARALGREVPACAGALQRHAA
jgi:hypothetical protein